MQLFQAGWKELQIDQSLAVRVAPERATLSKAVVRQWCILKRPGVVCIGTGSCREGGLGSVGSLALHVSGYVLPQCFAEVADVTREITVYQAEVQ